MKLDDIALRVNDLRFTPHSREFDCPCASLSRAGFTFKASWNGHAVESSAQSRLAARGIDYQFKDFSALVNYKSHPDGFYIDEKITISFIDAPCSLDYLSAGIIFNTIDLNEFTASPVPFRTGLDGVANVIDLGDPEECSCFAEGWVLSNSEYGLLVMRVPTGDPMTCFVPLVVREENGQKQVQVGSIGPDGDSRFSRNPYLDTEFAGEVVRLPTTRFVFFKGDWRTGYEIFRQMVETSLERCREPRKGPCPITYNTFHDFGPCYERARLVEIMPQLKSMGFGMLHLDPGWETVWGSNIWNEETMGSPDEFLRQAEDYGLQVGCWTSVHTTDADVHSGCYTTGADDEKYLAEDFTRFNPASVRLWGVCPASKWHDKALAHLSRLGGTGLRFLNSDFHDWPWSGESCQNKAHRHDKTLTRTQWALALNDFYAALHRQCPEMVIEMHDHVESGAYQTPVWYLYDRPDSYDEKWAYEFMWTTYQDLIDRKLFALYYLRLAEPIPLYLHINASTDNEHALAFWYVASCVTHIGVGAILRLNDVQKRAYQHAFTEYNARSEAFTLGRFYGIDELTHVHVYPDRRRAVVLAFNLSDQPMEREVTMAQDDWDMPCGEIKVMGGGVVLREDNTIVIRTAANGVTLLDVEAKNEPERVD